jgi:hypothetical protein
MAEQPAATPVVKKGFEPAAALGTKEDYETSTPRESSDANSPGGQGQQRKRKYEEATEDEKLALNAYHLQNPHLKQVNKPSSSYPLPRFLCLDSLPQEP